MSLWYAETGVRDLNILADYAIGDPFVAVDSGTRHDYTILYLSVSYPSVVADACVGANICVRTYLTVITNYGRSADGGSTVD